MNTGDARIVVLSGPSGSGKSTIVNRLIEQAPVRLMKAVSATTRPPRAGETEGVDYHFLSPEEFEHRRADGEFVECAEVFGAGHWYGTLKSELERIAGDGGWALLEIDVQGALDIMQKYPEAVTIFLTAASEEDYERRLRGRGTEGDGAIQQRLRTAREELKMVDRYQHRVVNDDLDRAVEEISNILLSREAELHA
jgi:guanylate kinase